VKDKGSRVFAAHSSMQKERERRRSFMIYANIWIHFPSEVIKPISSVWCITIFLGKREQSGSLITSPDLLSLFNLLGTGRRKQQPVSQAAHQERPRSVMLWPTHPQENVAHGRGAQAQPAETERQQQKHATLVRFLILFVFSEEAEHTHWRRVVVAEIE